MVSRVLPSRYLPSCNAARFHRLIRLGGKRYCPRTKSRYTALCGENSKIHIAVRLCLYHKQSSKRGKAKKVFDNFHYCHCRRIDTANHSTVPRKRLCRYGGYRCFVSYLCNILCFRNTEMPYLLKIFIKSSHSHTFISPAYMIELYRCDTALLQIAG